jgi:hypothetical protein
MSKVLGEYWALVDDTGKTYEPFSGYKKGLYQTQEKAQAVINKAKNRYAKYAHLGVEHQRSHELTYKAYDKFKPRLVQLVLVES